MGATPLIMQGRRKIWRYGELKVIQVLLKENISLLIRPKWEGGGAIAPHASPISDGPVTGTPLIMGLILLSIAWK